MQNISTNISYVFPNDPKMTPTWSRNNADMIKNDPTSIPGWVQSETKVSPTWIQIDPKTWAGEVRQGKKTRGTFLKDSFVSDCVLCRILALCAWYLSYVSDTCLMCRVLVLCVGYMSYESDTCLMCRVAPHAADSLEKYGRNKEMIPSRGPQTSSFQELG